MPPGFNAEPSDIYLDELQLVAANKISLGNEISGTNRLFAHAEGGENRQAAHFRSRKTNSPAYHGVGITGNLDIVFGQETLP